MCKSMCHIGGARAASPVSLSQERGSNMKFYVFLQGKVKLCNSSAVFEILSAAVEDPARWRKPSMRPAFRRLISAADARLALFPLHQQQAIKVWKMRIVTQIDILSNSSDQFANAFLELMKLLRRLP